jgi:branched-chain amino acid transport system permease protein
MKQAFVWLAVAVLMAVVPVVFNSSGALGELNLMGIMIVFALSYNVLFGQTGLLSFGHAVFYGLSGFAVVHATTAIGAAQLPIPLPLMPLLGGMVGWLFGRLLGAVATRRSGTAFAMITMGIGELVLSFAPILKTFFGGESGVLTDRTKVLPLFGLNFASQMQAYYLIAGWCLISMIVLHWITRTPFGRLCNAVRENPERADFIGYDVHRIRSMSFTVASFFGGLAGGLAAINFEIMSVDSMGGLQSAWVLFMTYIGGAGSFYGPVIGAIIISLMQFSLPDITPGWQLYSGLFFIVMVMYAPGGITGLLRMHEPLWHARLLHRMLPSYLLATLPVLIMCVGVSLMIEMSFKWGMQSSDGELLKFMGMQIQVTSPLAWIAAIALFALGVFLLRRLMPRVADAWAGAMHESQRRAGP